MTGTIRSSARSQALAAASSRKNRVFDRPRRPDGSYAPISEYFGCNTFSFDLMKQSIPESDVALLRENAPSKRRLTPELADKVAVAVREWALAKGATHYCHWFQPQTEATAEKHDAFFSVDSKSGPLEKFNGKLLMQQEPDASSFPSGGRRSTFEARGYTAWDATSPMFLMETDNGLTLTIPSVFVSYSGESLDQKTPLLRSITAVSEVATQTLNYLGHSGVKHVASTCGSEQEYFVADRALCSLRPDIALSGRTLLGRVPPKGQQLEDHYFGSIHTRILNFMMECEHELYKLGVPCKTRHNEVAPSQCEAAPIFEFANIAADHNQLVMEVVKTVARRHDLVAMFHEKPYQGMNGSGKHVNWSLQDSNGVNLLDPGDKPEENVRFLYFLAAAIKSVKDWGGLLRSSIASAGNDFRLGANEAPPAIMSVFLGETLSEVVNRFGSGDEISEKEREINLDLARVPILRRDNTDRNRTSPFAFTGNKFEFRAAGSSQTISQPLMILNTAMANSLTEMNKRVVELGGEQPKSEHILQVIKETFNSNKNVCFEGDNYSDEWHAEAESRGLPNLRNTPEALTVLKDSTVKDLFTKMKVFSTADELDSRYNVLIERYNKIRLIEAETLSELVGTHVLPAAVSQLGQMGAAAEAADDILGSVPAAQKRAYEKLSGLADSILTKQDKLDTLIAKLRNSEDEAAIGSSLAGEGIKLMGEIADDSGAIEALVSDDYWTLPKIRELIFTF